MQQKKADQIIKNLEKDYDMMAESFSRTRDRMWPELKFLFDYSRKNEKVLDLGCGNGRFSQYLQGADYTGVDASQKMIEQAKKRFPDKKFIKGSALDLPFKDNSFHKIYSIAMIHQIPSEEYRLKALSEMKRVLVENGMIFLTVWNLKPEDGKKDFFLKRDRYYYLFEKQELSSLAKQTGFTIIEEEVAEKENRSNIYLIAKKLTFNT
jgi:ubiquinone/menaquinone biosynthesis C-methylase UbiE